MARYIDAVCRVCRRNGLKLFLKGDRCFTPKCGVERRSSPPGQTSTRRRKQSDRGLQLREKQKGRYYYGLMERPFQKVFGEAMRRPGKTGEMLVQLLECRLDNVVLLMGFADSHAQARQIVRHGHLVLNDQKVNVPSIQVKAGDTVCWREPSKKSELCKAVAEKIKSKTIPAWLNVDPEKMCGKVISLPARTDTESRFDENAVVAYYSR
ncbi:MAG: 30S ribosomal protein S4 [Chloroflexi bacterium]|nr:30S ribosomal protein S4 [Chloroflexota bacterium]